jgi:hypothetical protein
VAKEAKTVRAAALSVSIFMMTGVAGAVPVFSGLGAHAGAFDGSLLAAASALAALPRTQPGEFSAFSNPPDADEFAYAARETRATEGIRIFAAVWRSFAIGDAAPNVFPSGISLLPECGEWMLASTGFGTLPFVRPRRLGPVPFE